MITQVIVYTEELMLSLKFSNVNMWKMDYLKIQFCLLKDPKICKYKIVEYWQNWNIYSIYEYIFILMRSSQLFKPKKGPFLIQQISEEHISKNANI